MKFNFDWNFIHKGKPKNTKEYNHEYYLKILKPKRQKQMSYKYIYHNKCSGGRATREVDGKDYCLGLLDMAYEYKFCDECLECPRFINNNIDKLVDNHIGELKGE